MPTYREMVVAAIVGIASNKGASAIAIERYIISNNPSLNFKRHLLRAALRTSLEKGDIARHHHHTNSYKIVRKKAPAKKKKPAAKKKAAAKKKKPAAKKKKTATKKKKPATKKKTTKKKTATKKKTTKKKTTKKKPAKKKTTKKKTTKKKKK